MSVSTALAQFWEPGKGSQIASDYDTLIVGSCFAYLLVIYLGERLMMNKQAVKCVPGVVVWNLLLSVLSGIGVILLLQHAQWRLLYPILAESDYVWQTRMVIATFSLTKAIEFGDTLWLVVKKKKLIFLHVYHHFTVTLYCWHAQKVNVGFAHQFAFINLFIHTIMYFYFAMAALIPGNKVLGKCRPFINTLQTVQMFVGTFICSWCISHENLVPSHYINCWLALAMYTSYCYLFTQFFVKNFLPKANPALPLYVTIGFSTSVFSFCYFLVYYSLLHVVSGFALAGGSLYLLTSSSPKTTKTA